MMFGLNLELKQFMINFERKNGFVDIHITA